MKNANRIFTGLFLIVALILIIQPASATTQSYLDPGYSYEIGYVASGSWQVYDLVVTNTDDYDILALAYNHVNNFDLYVYDTTTNTYITSATAPYSTENGITYIWAISTLKPGTYSVRIHSNGGAGNFAFIHFYNRQPIQRTVGTTTYTTTSPVTTPVTTSPSTSTTAYTYAKVEVVESHSVRAPDGSYSIRGTAKNVGTGPIEGIWFTVTYYDQDDNEIEQSWNAVDGMEPGQSVAFEFNGPKYEKGTKVVRYTIEVPD